jgi:glutaminyl-tRNA synthetase
LIASHISWALKPLCQNSDLRLHDRLVAEAGSDADGKDFLQSLNHNSLKVVTAYVEPSLADAQPDHKFQLERFRYFVADRADHVAGSKTVFNRVTSLTDSLQR